ncbi:MAG: formate dehydrogenase [Betaproteobacteria bacterium]
MTEKSKPASPPANLRRRGFLLSIGAGGAAAAAVALKPLSEASPSEQVAAPQAGQGYRDTQHIRDYYRTTKI